MATNSATRQRSWPAQMTACTALFGMAATALIAIDLVHFTLATGVATLV